MSEFEDFVKQDTPRLAVGFRRAPDGSEQFEWGIAGDIPPLTLIGCVRRAQDYLLCRERGEGWIPECPQPALVLVWDAEERAMRYYVHPDIPVEPLVGMLEVIAAMLTASRLAQRAASQRVAILGPDGGPMRR
jgi:hypothetical protein